MQKGSLDFGMCAATRVFLRFPKLCFYLWVLWTFDETSNFQLQWETNFSFNKRKFLVTLLSESSSPKTIKVLDSCQILRSPSLKCRCLDWSQTDIGDEKKVPWLPKASTSTSKVEAVSLRKKIFLRYTKPLSILECLMRLQFFFNS